VLRLDTKELEKIARDVRRDILRMVHAAKSGHPGGSLSAVELMCCLYFAELKHDPRNPCLEERDRVIFSKGHVAPLLYSCLARSGYMDVDELLTLRKFKSRLQGHPSCKCLPGVEVSTGSLGQGLSIGCGLAMGFRMDRKTSRVYVLLGDGETQEGQVWEAAMAAAHFKLDNLCAIIDHNGLQLDGALDDVMGIDPVPHKWQAFGWHTIMVDGHDIPHILEAYAEAKMIKNRPTVIIGRTTKGKGVSFMENRVEWHGRAPNDEELRIALAELE
jgi:transketolase